MEYIYTITNIINGRVYVGRTNDPYRRRKQHFDRLSSKSHTSKMMQNDYDVCGEESFSMKVVQEIQDSRSAQAAELAWMLALKSYNEYNKDDVKFRNLSGVKVQEKETDDEIRVTEQEKTIADVFKENVLTYCIENNINNHKFEQMCGLANGAINNWKNSNNISITTVDKVAKATGTDIYEWLYEKKKDIHDIAFYRDSIIEMINQIPHDFVLKYLWLFTKDIYEDILNYVPKENQ